MVHRRHAHHLLDVMLLLRMSVSMRMGGGLRVMNAGAAVGQVEMRRRR